MRDLACLLATWARTLRLLKAPLAVHRAPLAQGPLLSLAALVCSYGAWARGQQPAASHPASPSGLAGAAWPLIPLPTGESHTHRKWRLGTDAAHVTPGSQTPFFESALGPYGRGLSQSPRARTSRRTSQRPGGPQ